MQYPCQENPGCEGLQLRLSQGRFVGAPLACSALPPLPDAALLLAVSKPPLVVQAGIVGDTGALRTGAKAWVELLRYFYMAPPGGTLFV
jgi:hypothetical protein